MNDNADFSLSGHWAEWLQALDAVIACDGRNRATFLLRKRFDRARAQRAALPPVWSTRCCNTIALISFAPARTVTWCTSNPTQRRAFTRAPSSKGG
jgi:pyruvate dehydrogenase E1 component